MRLPGLGGAGGGFLQALGVAQPGNSSALLLFALVMLPMIIAGNRLGARVSGRVSDPAWRVTVGLILGGAAAAAFARLI